jgi:hypothetical protein
MDGRRRSRCTGVGANGGGANRARANRGVARTGVGYRACVAPVPDDVNRPADVLAEVEDTLREAFGCEPARASVSFLGVQPVEILRFHSDDVVSYVSLGMSRQPMTAPDSTMLAEAGPRAELLVQTRVDAGWLWRHLALLASAPVVEGVVYSDGMSVDLGVPLTETGRCTGGLVVRSALASVTTAAGPVDILRVLPATSTELAWARVHGSAQLLARWEQRSTDLLDVDRAAVALD